MAENKATASGSASTVGGQTGTKKDQHVRKGQHDGPSKPSATKPSKHTHSRDGKRAKGPASSQHPPKKESKADSQPVDKHRKAKSMNGQQSNAHGKVSSKAEFRAKNIDSTKSAQGNNKSKAQKAKYDPKSQRQDKGQHNGKNKNPQGNAKKGKEDEKSKGKPSTSKGGGHAFFEVVDEAEERARLAPIYQAQKQKAKIASGRTEVADGVLEDDEKSKLGKTKAKRVEAKSRLELETFEEEVEDDAGSKQIAANQRSLEELPPHLRTNKGESTDARKPKQARSSTTSAPKRKDVDDDKQDDVDPDDSVRTSVVGIVDVRAERKQTSAKKRKHEGHVASSDKDATKKQKRASFVLPPKQDANSDLFSGSGADAWGSSSAWS
ncbi:hypothetical protein BCV70DRAFT_231363 [Testicularia cyperi]|uniref:Uncharacterized protein n=1 Tax=Testicularia cyperi TaxID=1882483 RepID=A0A317XQF3_9BASI|nr:hypothetical protein BCV70DRAFT_231363 [Testicularia cyperi]